jgi:hypothetical protein
MRNLFLAGDIIVVLFVYFFAGKDTESFRRGKAETRQDAFSPGFFALSAKYATFAGKKKGF